MWDATTTVSSAPKPERPSETTHDALEGGGGFASILSVLLVLAAGTAIWLVYAYYNQSSSGQLLIKVSTWTDLCDHPKSHLLIVTHLLQHRPTKWLSPSPNSQVRHNASLHI
uniref:Movement protein n=1 Tax=Steinernema glaseri TaxID=37863 RepID=A0A1I7Y817_9BILA